MQQLIIYIYIYRGSVLHGGAEIWIYLRVVIQYFTNERSEWVKYCFHHEKIKFISSSHRVMFFLLYIRLQTNTKIIATHQFKTQACHVFIYEKLDEYFHIVKCVFAFVFKFSCSSGSRKVLMSSFVTFNLAIFDCENAKMTTAIGGKWSRDRHLH